MWSMNVIILLLFCYGCLSTGNRTVYFVSRNFYNVLHWDPLKPRFPGEKGLYSVQYWSDAKEQPYQIKEECQNITALSCNLTAETPSLHDVHYVAQVFVNGRIHGRTHRFKPLADTILGPPTLSIHTTVSSLHLNVSLPLGPNGVSIADIIVGSKNGPSKALPIYILKITHPNWAAQANKTTTGQFVISLMKHTKYCGYVVYKPSSEWGRSGSENASFCVTTQNDPLMLLPWLLVTAAVLAAIVIMSVVCMSNYVKSGKEKLTPQSLLPTPSTSPRVLQSPVLSISKLVVCPKNDQTVYATIQVKPNVQVGGYSPQDIPCQALQGSIGSSVGTGAHSPAKNSEATSAQSSEIYSVVAVHVPVEENRDFKATIEDKGTSKLLLPSSGESCDKGRTGPKGISHGVPPLPDLDPCESNPTTPLLLHTVRGPNGQLLLPSLTFQLQSSTGGTERRPLLSDLIDSKREGPSLSSFQSFDSSEWSDSGCDDSTVNTPTQPYCNTNYSPSQPVVADFTPSSDDIFDSGYKQNWLPAILPGTESKDIFEYRKTNHHWTWTAPKEEEEGEEDRAREERSSQIPLRGWVLQIQE